MRKRNIAIIAGGDTSEYEVSLRSAEGIDSFIDKEKYNLIHVLMKGSKWVAKCNGVGYDIDKNDFSFICDENKVMIDFAYITIHGTPGEDGLLQGYLDMMNIPYSCCGVLPAALTYNKFVCNHYLSTFGVKVADSLLLLKGQTIDSEKVKELIGLPCFIKPAAGGSSFGTTKVKTKEEVDKAIKLAEGECDKILIESFVDGVEVTCGCYKTKEKTVVFPITEVVTDNEFFDYDAKYNGQVEEITPARISEELAERIKELTAYVYDIVDASGIIRVDYIITRDTETIFLIEVNTTPGMTKTSFIPQQVRAAGLDIKDVMTDIIENKIKK